MLGLAILVVVLFLVALRRKKPRPKPPPHPYPDAAPVAYLESVDAAGRSRRFSLKPGGVSIGRAPDNEVVITQDLAGWDTVSRHHARIYQQEGQWIVDDLGSVNGVWVNSRRTGHNLLRSGTRLRVGEMEFVFHIGTGEASS
jgi:predicted component of type VI protein secretion system